jgi:PAS domain S-box-containing protein
MIPESEAIVKPIDAAADLHDEIAALVQNLHETEQRLQVLMGSEIDAVLYPGGQSYLLREAQEKLRRSEAAQRSLAAVQSSILNALPAHIALIDREGVIISVNDGWRSFAGTNGLQSSGCGLGQNYLEICDRAHVNHSKEALQAATGIRAVLSGTIKEFSLEYPCHAPTEQHWFQLMVAALDQDLPSGAAVMHVDITQRKLAQNAVWESEQRFRSMFEAAGHGIAIATPDGRYLQANAAYCRMLGYSEDELRTRNFASLTHPEDRALNQKKLTELLDGKIKNFGLEKRYLTKSGDIVWARTSVSPAHSAGGALAMNVVMAEDITERKLADFRLHRLNRLHTVLSKIGEAIVRTRDRQELYDTVCRIVVEDGLLRMVFVAEVDADAGVARPVASFGKGRDYLREPTSVIPMDGGPLSQGTVGMALRTGVHDFCNDIAAAARMKPWHETALKHGLRANASFPFRLRGVTTGVLVLYADETGYFLDDEIDLMDAVAGSVSFALEALEKEQERNLSKEALVETSARLETVMANSKDYIYFKDRRSRFVSISQPFLEFFRRTHLEEILGKSDADFFPEDQARAAFDDEQTIIASGQPLIDQEEKRTLPDGKSVWVLASKFPWSDAEGAIIGTWGISKDITERKRMEARFRRLVDSNAQAVLFWNTNGQISDGNDAFLSLVGYAREDLAAGRVNWAAMTPPEYAGRDRQALEEIAATGFCKSFEKEFFRKDGSRVPILIGATIFEDNRNEGVCFALDLTEFKKLEHQFLRAQRMESIGTLAGGVAHDLNNILAPILMSIDILKVSANDPQTREILETIETSAKRGADIVRQVLSFARGMDGQQIEVQPKRVLKDLENIIKDTFPKNIQLRFSIPDGLWQILGDPTQVHQVLLNLCVNARDAMPHGGTLTVCVENAVLDEQYASMSLPVKPGRFVKISVTDSGTGIARHIIDKIFEPFFTTKELNKGTGLGLSTVIAIVKSHHGTVNVYSEPDKGTTFRVYLPAMETSSGAGKGQPEQTGLPRGNGETVLMIDDEASILTITGQTLEAFGYRILTARDGAEAVAIYAEHKNEIAVVLTDMMMPVMDGLNLIRVLTRINPAIKIVAASGLAKNGSGSREPGGNIKHFLTKPYTAETLLKTIRAILDEP